jgi:hypothetical protein
MSATIIDVDYDDAGKVKAMRQRSVSGGVDPAAEWNSAVSTHSVSIAADGTS